MRKIIYILAIMATTSLYAQNSVDHVLLSIENNNTTLKALREQAQADKFENRTGIFLPSPEMEFNYLWGTPGNVGNRNDIKVTQALDFATISGMRSRLADSKNGLVDLQYKADRINTLLQAKQTCLDLIYYNALLKELEVRLEHAQTIETAFRDKLDSGDANALEYNKVKLNLSTVKGELARVSVERNALLSELSRLNGGVEIPFDGAQYQNVVLPLSFDDWFSVVQEKSPAMQYVKQEVEVRKDAITLSKGMGLPSLSAGYMRETVVGQNYQGISVGLSIPMWDNKNRVKQAKAALLAAESREADSRLQFYGQLQNSYERVVGLRAAALAYRNTLQDVNSNLLLKKALDAGEISLLDYIVEMGLYYNTINQALEAERDFQKAFAELSAVEL